MPREQQDPLEIFVGAVKNHHQSTTSGDYRNCNKQADKLHAAARQLLQGGAVSVDRFTTLLEHDDAAVRGMAAAYLLKDRTEIAVAALKPLARRKDIIGLGATECLKRYDRGELEIK